MPRTAPVRGTGAFAAVDAFDARAATPDASLLAGYDAVLAYSASPFGDAAGLGDHLAAYHDQGGGVVADRLGDVLETTSPLLAGVASLNQLKLICAA